MVTPPLKTASCSYCTICFFQTSHRNQVVYAYKWYKLVWQFIANGISFGIVITHRTYTNLKTWRSMIYTRVFNLSFCYRYNEMSKTFAKIFKTGPQYFARAPGRVNIIGTDCIIIITKDSIVRCRYNLLMLRFELNLYLIFVKPSCK